MKSLMDMTPFKYVCLHVLLDHHGTGIIEAHPNYILETLAKFSLEDFTDEDAWCKLDYKNHGRVLAWCRQWRYPVDPRFEKSFSDEMVVVRDLRAAGVDF